MRNDQARNSMRDAMRVGDGVFFYHSSCAEPGVAGLAELADLQVQRRGDRLSVTPVTPAPWHAVLRVLDER